MADSTKIKDLINEWLARVNLKLDSLTTERREAQRISQLKSAGYFDGPAYPVLPGFADFDATELSQAWIEFRADVEVLMWGGAKPGGYEPDNNFYQSPDAEILYLMVRKLKPRRIVEVGSGNSTRIIRQAIFDGGLSVEHIAIDPAPRSDIASLVDHMLLCRFEDADAEAHLLGLGENDFLFIDSSHEARVGNDVARLFCAVIPGLSSGVVVHVHDAFLPFEYPDPFCTLYPQWGEQYLLHLLLWGSRAPILWPGYFLQKLKPGVGSNLPFLNKGRAQSIWFKTGKSISSIPLQYI
jgi:hypothetical protein